MPLANNRLHKFVILYVSQQNLSSIKWLPFGEVKENNTHARGNAKCMNARKKIQSELLLLNKPQFITLTFMNNAYI